MSKKKSLSNIVLIGGIAGLSYILYKEIKKTSLNPSLAGAGSISGGGEDNGGYNLFGGAGAGAGDNSDLRSLFNTDNTNNNKDIKTDTTNNKNNNTTDNKQYSQLTWEQTHTAFIPKPQNDIFKNIFGLTTKQENNLFLRAQNSLNQDIKNQTPLQTLLNGNTTDQPKSNMFFNPNLSIGENIKQTNAEANKFQREHPIIAGIFNPTSYFLPSIVADVGNMFFPNNKTLGALHNVDQQVGRASLSGIFNFTKGVATAGKSIISLNKPKPKPIYDFSLEKKVINKIKSSHSHHVSHSSSGGSSHYISHSHHVTHSSGGSHHINYGSSAKPLSRNYVPKSLMPKHTSGRSSFEIHNYKPPSKTNKKLPEIHRSMIKTKHKTFNFPHNIFSNYMK